MYNADMAAPELENPALLELQGQAAQPLTQGATLPTGFSINGQPGPVFTFTSSSGFGFAGAGNTVTLSVTNAAAARTALGIDAAATKKSNLAAVVAPAVGDDSGDGYGVGSLWIDTALGDVYMACDVTVGAAVWRKLN